jgi:site-specific DNA-methyltransferase (adenine-specific)
LPAIGKWEKSCGKHPTQKPLSVLSRIIQASTRPGDWILDPFCGSGTAGIAASLLGRNFLGLEIEDEFLAMSRARRIELDDTSVREDFLCRLAKSNIIPCYSAQNIIAEPPSEYGEPW